MLNAAIEDGLMASNPAAKFGRILKLTVSRTTVQEQTEAMKKAQRQLFLATASHESPCYLTWAGLTDVAYHSAGFIAATNRSPLVQQQPPGRYPPFV